MSLWFTTLGDELSAKRLLTELVAIAEKQSDGEVAYRIVVSIGTLVCKHYSFRFRLRANMHSQVCKFAELKKLIKLDEDSQCKRAVARLSELSKEHQQLQSALQELDEILRL